MAVSLDPDNLLPCDIHSQFPHSLRQYDSIFKPDLPGNNDAVGPITAHINMGPVEPP